MSKPTKKTEQEEPITEAQRRKQNQDYEGLPAASEKQNPPDIDKKDIQKSSKLNKDGKTDNIGKRDNG